MYIIYALIDPRNYEVRYIGLTRAGYSRFVQHLSKDGKNHRKNGWVQELEDIGEMVIFEMIDKASSFALAQRKEAFWIHFYQSKLFNRTIPKSTLPDASLQAAAHIQMFSKLENLEWAFIEVQERRDSLFGHISLSGCAVYEDVNMVSYHFYVAGNSTYAYAVRYWAKRAFQDHTIVGYRFALKGVEWATFGDAEAIHRCEDREMKWVRLSRQQGTENWNVPVYIPSRDEFGNLLYHEKQHGARSLREVRH
jgi:hypothetical protein